MSSSNTAPLYPRPGHLSSISSEAGLATVGYFNTDFGDQAKRSACGLLSSLLRHSTIQSDNFCEILHSLFSRHDHGLQQPSENAQALPGQSLFYTDVDGLDEYPNFRGFPSPREQALEVVKDLVNLPLHLHLCITSRPEMDIRATYFVSLHDKIGQIEDVVDYVKAMFYPDAIIREWPEEDKWSVIDTLAESAHGM
jgi:hypothetical protein